MKWGVVLAGATDFLRPPEKLSLTQNLALMATGSIWTRWCFIIKPRNILYVARSMSIVCYHATVGSTCAGYVMADMFLSVRIVLQLSTFVFSLSALYNVVGSSSIGNHKRAQKEP